MEEHLPYKSLFNLNPIAIYIWKKIDNDLKLIDFNTTALSYTEGKVEEFKGVTLTEMYGDKPEIFNDFNRCLKFKEEINREMCYKYISTGKQKILDVSYKYVPPNFVFVFTQDITQQKLNENSLRKTEREKSLILSSIAEHVIFQDSNHNIIWANKAAADSIDMTFSDLIGKKCYSLWCNPDGPIKECPIQVCLKTRLEAEAEIETSDGRVWHIEGYPVFDEKNQLIGAVEVTNEITQLRSTQRNLKTSEKQYREAYNRSRFYKDLFAHDINNIFQNILSSTELLALNYEKDKNIDLINSLIDIIKLQLDRGKKLASNVRKLSDLDESEIVLDKIDIVKILMRSKSLIVDAFPQKEIQIIINSDYEMLYILADDLLNELIENIMNNSVHHNIKPIVEIEINISKEFEENKNFIKLEIIDNGIGIPDENKLKVFIRGDLEIKNISGSGLGLKLVKKLVDNYDGKIWIEDKIKGDYSVGSKFILLFPEAN